MDIAKLLGTSPRTTIMGLLMILLEILRVARPDWGIPEWAPLTAGGFGLMFTRDNLTTSEKAGAVK